MKGSRLFAWTAFAIGALYFFLPLIGTFEFSLRMIRGEYSFEAYRVVFADRASARPSPIRPRSRSPPSWWGC